MKSTVYTTAMPFFGVCPEALRSHYAAQTDLVELLAGAGTAGESHAYLQKSDWDSRVLERSSWRLNGLFGKTGLASAQDDHAVAREALVQAIDACLREHKAAFAHVNLAGSAQDWLQRLCQPAGGNGFPGSGWRPVESLATFTVRPPERTDVPDPECRDLNPAWNEQVIEIARYAFSAGRILQDHALPLKSREAFFAEMARSFCKRVETGELGMRCLLDGGRVQGFSVAAPDPDTTSLTGRQHGVLNLIAVRPDARGKGYGHRLLRDFLSTTGSIYDRVEVSTQVTNDQALALYSRSGLTFSGLIYQLHWHA